MMNRWGRIDRQGPGEREREKEREQTQLMTVFNLDLNRESVSEPKILSGRLFQCLCSVSCQFHFVSCALIYLRGSFVTSSGEKCYCTIL